MRFLVLISKSSATNYADSHKNKDWQAFAAATALSVTKPAWEPGKVTYS